MSSNDGVQWTPRPDPAEADLQRPGLRPHRHPANRLHGWVFLQHQVWVDYWGNEHEIELMSLDYVDNVIRFCHRQTPRIALLIAADTTYVAQTGLAAWMGPLPLLVALRRRQQGARPRPR
jgi:hypothetical protein